MIIGFFDFVVAAGVCVGRWAGTCVGACRIVGAGTRVAAVDGMPGIVGIEEGRGKGVATDAGAEGATEDDAGVTACGATGGTADTDRCGCERVGPPSEAVGASAGATDGV